MRSTEEETINAYTHLLWSILSISCGLFFLLDPLIPSKFKTASVFMTGLSGWTFFSSFLYHMTNGRKKSQNREVDKTSIFLMIIGCGISINMSCLDTTLATISSIGLVSAGTLLTLMYSHKKEPSEVFSLTSYVLLGWFCILPITGFMGDSLYHLSESSWTVIAGGISYSVGILFYAKDSIKWNHTKWHICVMLGYSFHLFGHYKIMQYVSVS